MSIDTNFGNENVMEESIPIRMELSLLPCLASANQANHEISENSSDYEYYRKSAVYQGIGDHECFCCH